MLTALSPLLIGRVSKRMRLSDPFLGQVRKDGWWAQGVRERGVERGEEEGNGIPGEFCSSLWADASPGCGRLAKAGLDWVWWVSQGRGHWGVYRDRGLPNISLPKSEGSGLAGDMGTVRVISQRGGGAPGPFLSMSEKAHIVLNWTSGSAIFLFLS